MTGRQFTSTTRQGQTVLEAIATLGLQLDVSTDGTVATFRCPACQTGSVTVKPDGDLNPWCECELGDVRRALDPSVTPDEPLAFVSTSRKEAKQAWPAPLGDEALYGLAGDFVRLVGPHSEADPAGLLAQFLAVSGTLIGAEPHAYIDGQRHPSKIWALVVGDTAAGRKGTSLTWATKVAELADPTFAERQRNAIGSGEVIVWEVRDETRTVDRKGEVVVIPGVPDKRLLIVESEFAGLLTVAGRKDSTASPIVRQAWDRDRLQTTTKTNAATATGAHVGIVGHITPEELRRKLTDVEVANGFMNRFLLVCVQRSKELPRGGHLRDRDLEPIAARLRDVMVFAQATHEVGMTDAAWAVWDAKYGDLSKSRKGVFGAATGRAAPYVRRLAVLFAILDKRNTVDVAHLRAALEVWRYCEQSAAHLFDSGKVGDTTTDRVLDALKDSPQGLTRTAIRDLFQRHLSVERVDQALAELTDANLVVRETVTTGGRPAERWQVRRDQSDTSDRSGSGEPESTPEPDLWSLRSLRSQHGNGKDDAPPVDDLAERLDRQEVRS